MRSSRRLTAVFFIIFILCSSMLSCGSPEETENSEVINDVKIRPPTDYAFRFTNGIIICFNHMYTQRATLPRKHVQCRPY